MMNRAMKLGIKVLVGLAVLVVMVVWIAGGFHDRVSPGVVATQAGEALPAGVETVVVEHERVESWVELPGTLASERTIHLSARISAYVKDLSVSSGQRVVRGQRLIELDDRELREQLRGAEAQLAQAETEHARTKELLAQQAATQQAYDRAQSAYVSAKAAVEQMRVMLSYCTIEAPIDGVVTERRIEIGDLANPGQVLAAVYDPARMRLEVAVPVRLVDRLSKGSVVDVELSRPDLRVQGEVTEIVSQVDPTTRTQLVKVLLDLGDRELLPGTYGRLLLGLAPHMALLVPATAVERAGQLEFVEEVRGGRVVRALVRTGPRHGDRVELLSGLLPGAVILPVFGEGR